MYCFGLRDEWDRYHVFWCKLSASDVELEPERHQTRCDFFFQACWDTRWRRSGPIHLCSQAGSSLDSSLKRRDIQLWSSRVVFIVVIKADCGSKPVRLSFGLGNSGLMSVMIFNVVRYETCPEMVKSMSISLRHFRRRASISVYGRLQPPTPNLRPRSASPLRTIDLRIMIYGNYPSTVGT